MELQEAVNQFLFHCRYEKEPQPEDPEGPGLKSLAGD